jgi:hypothetical protein
MRPNSRKKAQEAQKIDEEKASGKEAGERL